MIIEQTSSAVATAFERLKARHRAERDSWPPNLALRVHRALSWLHGAERLAGEDDLDGQFVYLWIAFNAAYANDIDEKYRESEQQTFRGFVDKLAKLDAGRKRFDALVWQEFPRSIRVLLDNPYVYADFWRAQNGTLPKDEWKASFDAANRAARTALGRLRQSRAAAGLHQPDGEARAARDRGDDGSSADAVGRCVLSGGGVRERVDLRRVGCVALVVSLLGAAATSFAVANGNP